MKHFKYFNFAESLRKSIEEGHWQVNDKLPSIRELAKEFKLSKISVQHGLQLLETRGYLQVKPKSGYYVSASPNRALTGNIKTKIDKPKPVNVPDVFFDIMERSAAFDIAPTAKLDIANSIHLQSLNRHIGRAMRQHQQSNALYYAPPGGVLMLREQIALRYQRRGADVSAENVCITSGCQNSLYLALQVLCEPGDIVAVESPAFYGVIQLLQHLKLNIVEIPSSYTRGINAQGLEHAAKKWPIKACVFTPNFTTPTGAAMTETAMQELLTVAKQNNVILVEDDIYGDLGFHKTNPPLKKFDNNGQVILCSSLSKSLSRDLRLGWVISNPQAKSIAHAKLVNQLSNSTALQQGVAAFMKEGNFERYLQLYRRQLFKQREQLLQAINQYWQFDVRYTVPEGGLSLWLQLPSSIDTLALYHEALKLDIVITPGCLFSSMPKYQSNMRMSFAHQIQNERLTAIKELGSLIASKL